MTKLTENDIDTMKFIGPKEIAALMGCSVSIAREIMKKDDFPLIKCGKNMKVMKSQFIKWASEKHD